MKQTLFIVAALALSGCVSHNFSEGERTSYRCDGGHEFTTRDVPGAIEVYASGTTHRLTTAGGDQYRSTDGSVILDANARTLSGVHQGPFQNCRRQMRWSRYY